MDTFSLLSAPILLSIMSKSFQFTPLHPFSEYAAAPFQARIVSVVFNENGLPHIGLCTLGDDEDKIEYHSIDDLAFNPISADIDLPVDFLAAFQPKPLAAVVNIR